MPVRIDLSDHDAALLAQASRLMSEALDRSGARGIALVEEKADGSDLIKSRAAMDELVKRSEEVGGYDL